jgi:hypothetical protein
MHELFLLTTPSRALLFAPPMTSRLQKAPRHWEGVFRFFLAPKAKAS